MGEGFDVDKVARLAALRLEPDQAARLAEEFRAILGLVDRVRALPLEGVPPAVHGLAPELQARDDSPRPCLGHAEALETAPDVREGHFRVPPILPPGSEA